MLRIFKSVKIQRLWPGLNPRPWLPEASMLTSRPPKPSSGTLNGTANLPKLWDAVIEKQGDYIEGL
jgi:hypothetical protein